jgi:hypothetical protein
MIDPAELASYRLPEEENRRTYTFDTGLTRESRRASADRD